MGFFNREKTNYVGEMREYIKKFMLKYIKEYPSASDVVIPIFSNAEQMVRGLSEKQISKMMKTNNVNIECGALNIIQNFAMTELEPKSGVDFLRGDNYAYDLYNYVNEYKYANGYISKLQFEENKMLATKLSLQSPLGSWF
ncbi:MAG: hypothetical protein J6K88_05980 [Oscillospiraceae bacterium]|nr:hypothetical protein [Oscillospiraceae bacterium]